MIAIAGAKLSMHKGDSGIVEVQVFSDATLTTPLDITGHVVVFVVGDDYAELFGGLVLDKDNVALGGLVITDPVNGKYQIQFAKSWTNALTVKAYVYSTKVITPGGSVYTIATGPFELLQNLPHE